MIMFAVLSESLHHPHRLLLIAISTKDHPLPAFGICIKLIRKDVPGHVDFLRSSISRRAEQQS